LAVLRQHGRAVLVIVVVIESNTDIQAPYINVV
jgi:hypothetical protein